MDRWVGKVGWGMAGWLHLRFKEGYIDSTYG